MQEPYAIMKGHVQVMNKRALFIVNSFGGGGAESVCITLASVMERKGYACEFVTLDDKRDFEISENFVIHSLAEEGGKTFRGIVKKVIKLCSVVNDRGGADSYDLITAHLPWAHLITRLSPLSAKAGYVVHGSQKLSTCSRFPFYGFLLRKLFGGRKVIAVSEGIKNELNQVYGIPSESITTIYNPVSNSAFERMASTDLPSERASNSSKRPYILAVGRLVESKRIDRCIEVFSKGKFYEKYDLYIAGEGECFDALKKQVDDFEIEEFVKFLGFVSDPYSCMKQAALVLSTSDSESLGQAIIEALANGTKVVSSDCEYGPREIMTGDLSNYLIKPVDDINAYIRVINSAFASYPSLPPSSLSAFSEERAFEAYERLLIDGDRSDK